MTGEPPMTKPPNGDLVIHMFRASWTISRSSLRPGRKSAIRDSQRWVYCLKIGQNHPKLTRNMEGDGIAFDMLCSIRYIDWWTFGHNSNSGSLSLSHFFCFFLFFLSFFLFSFFLSFFLSLSLSFFLFFFFFFFLSFFSFFLSFFLSLSLFLSPF